MINPAGDTKDAGRTLNDSFERGITLQFSQELKKKLETEYPDIRVILTRMPGETLEPLQNANFANRLDIDFYLSIHFYKESNPKPELTLYHYLIETYYVQTFPNLHFYSFDNAFLININKTINYGNQFKKLLDSSFYKNKFCFNGFLGIPFKPLIGIKAPALALEIGLKNSSDWHNYLEPIKESINLIIQQYKNE